MTAALTQDRKRSAVFVSGDVAQVIPAVANLSLAELCRAALGGEAGTGGIPRANADDLATLAVRSRMTSPASRGFAALGGEALSPPLAAAVKAARTRAAIANGRVMALARIAFPILDAAGIAAIAFKGPFQHRLLHGDPFFFRSGDLDLLVAREHFAAALAAFEAAGFTRREGTSAWWTNALGEVHLEHPQGGVIDLHHRLQQPGCPPPRDCGAFLRGAAREDVGGVAIAVPTHPQAVLIAMLNFIKEFAHRRPSARYAYDVAAGLLGLDEAGRRALAALVTDQRLSGTAGLAAALVERIFALDLPLPAPLQRPPLPAWAGREALLAMAFDPEAPDTPWPRRRAILWAMCSGEGTAQRAGEFSREAARMIASEALRRAAGSGE